MLSLYFAKFCVFYHFFFSVGGAKILLFGVWRVLSLCSTKCRLRTLEVVYYLTGVLSPNAVAVAVAVALPCLV